jgi:hypothetical protein
MATLAFAGNGGPWQRSLRWSPPIRDWRWIAGGIAFALLLTAIEVDLFDVAMRREVVRVGQAPPNRVLDVDLIEERAPVETPAEPAPPPLLRAPAEAPRKPTRAARREAPRSAKPDTGPQATAIPKLVGLDGHILLPDESTEQNHGEPEALAGHIVHGDPFARANPVPYEPTRFDAYFPDVRESLGGEVIRKTTVSHAWYTPWGTMVECKASLILIGIGVCTWGPAPRLTEEQLRALRADPPLLGQPPADNSPASEGPQPPLQ